MTIAEIIKMRGRIRVKRIIKIGLAIAFPSKPHSNDVHGVVVLMYHRVNDFRGNELSVRLDEFRKQVRWLHETGFKNMRMRELESLLERNEPLPDKRHVVFSFDDGYEDNFTTVVPILKEFGYTGMFYLATDFIGSEKMYQRDRIESRRVEHNRIMNWEQVSQMLSDGMEIGSHSMTHAILTEIPDDTVWQEIIGSKKILEAKLGADVTSFCYPGGFLNDSLENMVRKAGYRSACTVDMGIWCGGNIMRIPRVGIPASDNMLIFKSKVLGRMDGVFTFRAKVMDRVERFRAFRQRF
jgi:peptidoglycan/xylan/chitin deacetylase (PgdA/CDA1 family)